MLLIYFSHIHELGKVPPLSAVREIMSKEEKETETDSENQEWISLHKKRKQKWIRHILSSRNPPYSTDDPSFPLQLDRSYRHLGDASHDHILHTFVQLPTTSQCSLTLGPMSSHPMSAHMFY